MNATARFKIERVEPDLEVGAERAADTLISNMEDALGNGLFASLATLERDGPELVVRLLAYVEEDLLSEFERVCNGCVPFSPMSCDTRTDREGTGMVFHLNAIQELCAGCMSEVSSGDEELRQKIGIRRALWRYPGPTDCRHLFFSKLLTSTAIEAACFPGMKPLSAIDSGAIKWALAGWELREYPDRRSELQLRRDELASLDRQWRCDPAGWDRQANRRLEAWDAILPEQRVRAWKGWW
jgi:hypothetical protein